MSERWEASVHSDVLIVAISVRKRIQIQEQRMCFHCFLSLHTQQANVPEEAYLRRAQYVKIYILFLSSGICRSWSWWHRRLLIFVTWHKHHQDTRALLVPVLLKVIHEVYQGEEPDRLPLL
jgi:hypothetical protein